MVKFLNLDSSYTTCILLFTIPLYVYLCVAKPLLVLVFWPCIASICLEGGKTFLKLACFIKVLVSTIKVSHGGIVVAFVVHLTNLHEIFIAS